MWPARASKDSWRVEPATRTVGARLAQTLLDATHRVPDRKSTVESRCDHFRHVVAIAEHDRRREPATRGCNGEEPRISVPEVAFDPCHAISRECDELALMSPTRSITDPSQHDTGRQPARRSGNRHELRPEASPMPRGTI